MKTQTRMHHGLKFAFSIAATALFLLPRIGVAGNWNAKNVSELIAAINAANSAGGVNTITLAPGKAFTLTTVNNTTDGPNGLPVIAANNNLTIRGNGATISRSKATGTPAFRLFDVAPGASLALDSLTLANGLVVGDTGMDASGGAILNSAGATLAVKYSILLNNQVVGGDGAGGLGGFGYGGAVCSDGTANFDGVIFHSNQARGGATANSPDLSGFGGAALGGAIVSQNDGTLAPLQLLSDPDPSRDRIYDPLLQQHTFFRRPRSGHSFGSRTAYHILYRVRFLSLIVLYVALSYTFHLPITKL